jgi:hypothetical protein
MLPLLKFIFDAFASKQTRVYLHMLHGAQRFYFFPLTIGAEAEMVPIKIRSSDFES